MSQLEVAITAGPTRGQRVRVLQSPAAFGRDPGNPLVIDLPTVSRVHGELHRDGDDWTLHNLSPNGTRVNGKRVTTKPRTLHHGDSIVVGDEEVMTVTLRPGTPSDDAAEGGRSRDDDRHGQVGRRRALSQAQGQQPHQALGVHLRLLGRRLRRCVPPLRRREQLHPRPMARTLSA